ncbi:putative DBH-like monooxygenase protein 2 [Saguinus oedipus]|uniref:DBH-like monooxygenase protein 2 n=1 Tax=Saguinus oedipus TaxID=9490 RepID=A0ABQ9UI68_SAGOE|nr:putative DBH-like monooxygenase protein 2 [Saguinus oedipus]
MACDLLFRLFLLLALAAALQSNRLGPTSRLRYSRFLDPSNVMFLLWDFDLEAEIISFELQVRTAGWVGLGVTNRYTNMGSDLVVGGVLPNGNVYFSDQHLVDEDTLQEDASQDAELLGLTEDAVYTTMRFSRPFRSCDPHDLDITVK